MKKNAGKHFRRKKVRLYRKIDLDLITLYKHPKFSLPKAIVMSLQMCANGQVKYIRLPEPYILRDVPKEVEFSIEIPENDVATMEWFNSIPSGKRNDAIKNIIRGYLCGPVISSYTKTAEKDNIAGFNSSEKDMIECEKSRKDIEKASEDELKQIQKILAQDGVSPESLLAFLREGKQAQKQAAINALEDEAIPDGISGRKENEEKKAVAGKKDDSKPATEPITDVPGIETGPEAMEADSARTDAMPETAQASGLSLLAQENEEAEGDLFSDGGNEDEEDSDFDLFGAMKKMMEDI